MNRPITVNTLPTSGNRVVLPSRVAGAPPGLFVGGGEGMISYALPTGIPLQWQNMHNIPSPAAGGLMQGHHLANNGGQTFVLNNIAHTLQSTSPMHMPVGPPSGPIQFIQTSGGAQFQHATMPSTSAMASFVNRPPVRPGSISGGATQQANLRQPIKHATVSPASAEAQKLQQKPVATSANKRRPAAKTTAGDDGAGGRMTNTMPLNSRLISDAEAARGQKRPFELAEPTFVAFDVDDIKSDDYSPLNSSNISAAPVAASKQKPPVNNRRKPNAAAQAQYAASNTGNKNMAAPGDAGRRGNASATAQNDYYDIVDMASTEESQRMESTSLKVEAIRSNLPDTDMLNKQAVLHIMQDVGQQQDVRVSEVIEDDVVRLMTLAAEQKLRNIIEQLAISTEHRLENVKNHPNWAECSDLRAQLLFIAKAEKAELMRRGDPASSAATSSASAKSAADGGGAAAAAAGATARPSVDEAEIQRLRELQRRKAEEMKNQQANQAAMAALAGTTRRRPKLEALTAAPPTQSGIAGRSIGTGYRPHVKVVKLVDLAFVFENDAEWRNTARYWDVMHAIALAETPDEKARRATSGLGSLANSSGRLGLE